MSEIGLGDKVFKCRSWRPGLEAYLEEVKGEGVVTLIIDNNEKKYRVVWGGGIYSWHKEDEFVNTNKVIKCTVNSLKKKEEKK